MIDWKQMFTLITKWSFIHIHNYLHTFSCLKSKKNNTGNNIVSVHHIILLLSVICRVYWQFKLKTEDVQQQQQQRKSHLNVK